MLIPGLSIKPLLIAFMWYPLRIAAQLLPVTAINTLGRYGGLLLYFLSRKKQKIMSAELKKSLQEKTDSQIDAIVSKAFINYCLSETQMLLYPRLNPRIMDRIVRIRGREHLDRALEKGTGVLLFQAHFGAFQMVMPAIGYKGYTMNQISASASLWDEDRIPEIQRKSIALKAAYELMLPVRHIPVKSTMRPVFRALKRNEIVGITVDGGGGARTLNVRFLGRPANFQKGPVDLALRTGAQMIPALITTGKGLSHTLDIHPPIEIDRSLNQEAAIRNGIEAFIRILETYVNRYPDHYGYTLCLRRSRAVKDPYPFFGDYTMNPTGKL